ncbi:hypothetical protein GOODEAATRI_007299 [Goodea atripinnis]|uniref:Uncharacterized protein n=1 Tax=Goodea atripinnis TaxID=208336 RepID=A0ABV0MFS5_9TELE
MQASSKLQCLLHGLPSCHQQSQHHHSSFFVSGSAVQTCLLSRCKQVPPLQQCVFTLSDTHSQRHFLGDFKINPSLGCRLHPCDSINLYLTLSCLKFSSSIHLSIELKKGNSRSVLCGLWDACK